MSVTEFVTPVRVVDGTLKVTNLAHLSDGLKEMRNGGYILRLEQPKASRSNRQNAAYWVGYVAPLSEYTGYDPMAIHGYLKRRFLPNPHLMIQDRNGVVIDEADIEPTTTNLTSEQFAEYLNQIAAWAASSFDLKLGSDRDD